MSDQTPMPPALLTWLNEIEVFGLRSERLVEDLRPVPLSAAMPWLLAAYEVGRASSTHAMAIREAYDELCELHVFLQGFDASETGALSEAYEQLTSRIRDNAQALEPLVNDAPAPASGWQIIEGDGQHLTLRDDEADREIVVDTDLIEKAQTLTPDEVRRMVRQEHLRGIIAPALIVAMRRNHKADDPITRMAYDAATVIAQDMIEVAQAPADKAEAAARIIDPAAWGLVDEIGLSRAEELGISTKLSLDRARKVLETLGGGVEQLMLEAQPEWSFRDDDAAAPRPFWHLRLNLGDLSTDWRAVGRQGQRWLSVEETAEAEAKALERLRRDLASMMETR